jgi:hypothetical protein
MAAATGLAATASARLTADPNWRARCAWLARATAERQGDHGRLRGLWGYEFDVQTRWGFYGADSPNIVATSFAAHGSLDGEALAGERVKWLGQGLLEQFWRGHYFAYTPSSNVLIHNASLLGAALAARLSELPDLEAGLGKELREAAGIAASTAVELQRPDGSWPYGEGQGLEWVDGYHTAYSLLGLDAVCVRGLADDRGVALEKGARFYFDRMFDGEVPRFYAGHPGGPKDVNNVATALRAAVWAAKRGSVAPGFPARVFGYLRRRYWNRQGYFMAGAERLRPTARLDYPRWAGAPALDALTALAAEGAP